MFLTIWIFGRIRIETRAIENFPPNPLCNRNHPSFGIDFASHLLIVLFSYLLIVLIILKMTGKKVYTSFYVLSTVNSHHAPQTLSHPPFALAIRTVEILLFKYTSNIIL